MITIQTDRQSFAYDIHSLVKAFYPEQEVHVEREVYTGQNPRTGQAVPPDAQPAAQTEKREQKTMETPEEETQKSLRLVVSFVTAESAREREAADGRKQSQAARSASAFWRTERCSDRARRSFQREQSAGRSRTS